MSVNRKETIGDPNSFKDINYELLIDFRLTVDGYLHNTPPVKEYSWEEFQQYVKNICDKYEIKTFAMDYYTRARSFEKVFTLLVYTDNIAVPFTSRSYFSPLTDETLAEFAALLGYLNVSKDSFSLEDAVANAHDYTVKALKEMEITKK